MNQNDMSDRRTDNRMFIYQECFLINESAAIKPHTVDVSKMGVGVLVYGTTPFEKNDKLTVRYMQRSSRAEVKWAKKDVNNNTTRLGLELFPQLTYF